MIRFACHCKHVFSLADDMAGGLIQCPHCGRLNDVPTLSDLPNLTEEGTYKLDEQAGNDPDLRVAELSMVFNKATRDARGVDIDLRTSLEDLELTGDIPLKPEPPSPKYDPVTGELIRPIEVKPDAEADIDPASIPMAGQAINYATRGLDKTVGPARILLELFLPANMVVMFFILAALIAGALVVFPFIPISLLLGINIFYFNIPFWVTIPHYVNTIDETGPQGRDELPRPLRELNWSEDLFGPFYRGMLAAGIAYLPLIVFRLIEMRRELPESVAVMLFILCSLFFPAVLLTAATSGSILNLRPDRILAVMWRSGFHYWIAAALWTIFFPIFLWVMLTAEVIDFSRIVTWDLSPKLQYLPVMSALLLIGVYVMHFFCWYLGLLYRAHHDSYPWVLQRHVRHAPDTGQSTPKDTRTRLRELREMEKQRQHKGAADASSNRTHPARGDIK